MLCRVGACAVRRLTQGEDEERRIDGEGKGGRWDRRDTGGCGREGLERGKGREGKRGRWRRGDTDGDAGEVTRDREGDVLRGDKGRVWVLSYYYTNMYYFRTDSSLPTLATPQYGFRT